MEYFLLFSLGWIKRDNHLRKDRKMGMKNYKPAQPASTYLGTPIAPKKKGLPKQTESICPECIRVIPAILYDENGRVMMVKECPEHGEIKDIIWSDTKLYLQMEEWDFGDNCGISNPHVKDAVNCPDDCGLCNIHTSHTSLANIDLTNRCNLTCPICFANANASGSLFEPSYEQVVQMMKNLRNEKPVACRLLQFSGGEPLVYPHFLEVVRKAKELGFTHIQIASNGLKLADRDFAMRCAEVGLHSIYLQFDGIGEEPYMKTRGEPVFDKKLKAIENIREAGMKIVFVPTIVKGVNDLQVGKILEFALENIDVMSGISYQPVTFTGRISYKERQEKRFTLTDLARCIEEQTGIAEMYRDWYPLNSTAPFSRLLGKIRGEETVTLTCHSHCSIGTYLFVDENKKGVPVTRFMDIGEMYRDMDKLARSGGFISRINSMTKAKVFNSLRKHFHEDRAPEGLTFMRFLQTLEGFVDKSKGRGDMDGKYTYKTLLVAGMHFMDSYNYDIERVKRCVIHYASPDGKIYPFCVYNSGPTIRDRIEKEFALSDEEVLQRAEEENYPPELERLVKRIKARAEKATSLTS